MVVDAVVDVVVAVVVEVAVVVNCFLNFSDTTFLSETIIAEKGTHTK